MRFILVSVFLCILFISNTVYSASPFYKFKYTVRLKDNIITIFKKFVKRGTKLNSKSKMIRQTVKANRNIKSWKKLKVGQKIILFVDKRQANRLNIKKYLISLKKKSPKNKIKTKKVVNKKKQIQKKKRAKKKVITQKKTGPKKLKYYAFYRASSSSFSEAQVSAVQVDTSSLSVMGIGGGLWYDYSDKYKFNAQLELFPAVKVENELGDDQLGYSYKLRLGAIAPLWLNDLISPTLNLELENLYTVSSVVNIGGQTSVSFLQSNKLAWLEFGAAVELDKSKESGMGVFLNYAKSISGSSGLKTDVALLSEVEDISMSGTRLGAGIYKKFRKRYMAKILYHIYSLSTDTSELDVSAIILQFHINF